MFLNNHYLITLFLSCKCAFVLRESVAGQTLCQKFMCLPRDSKKMSHLSVEHGAVDHEEALRTAGKGLTTGLKGWRT